MITINTHYGTVDMSTDLRNEHRDRLRALDKYKGIKFASDTASLDLRIYSMLDQNLAFAAEYVTKNKHPAPQSARFLMAHGDSFNEQYMYLEKAGKKVYVIPVNSWIDKHAGNYEALFVLASNPGRKLRARESSLLVYPIGQLREMELAFGKVSADSGLLQIIPPKKIGLVSRMMKGLERF